MIEGLNWLRTYTPVYNESLWPLPIITDNLNTDELQAFIQHAQTTDNNPLCGALRSPLFCIYEAEYLVSVDPTRYFCSEHAYIFARYWSRLGRKPALFPLGGGAIGVLDHFGPEWLTKDDLS